MYATNDFRKGLKIEIDKVPYEIIDFQHVSPGKGSSFTRTKLKNMLYNTMTEKTFKSHEKVDQPDMIEKEMQYMYQDAEGYHFMDTADYEQVALSKDNLGESTGYLQENLKVAVLYYNGRPIGVTLPNFVELKVKRTDPAFKGDTVTGGTKPAELEAGAVVQVPFHIKEGDVLRIDTRDNRYVEKVNR